MTQENISATGENLNNEMQERRNKLNALREQGQAYPNDFRRDAVSSDIIKALGDKSAEELAAEKRHIEVDHAWNPAMKGGLVAGIIGGVALYFLIVWLLPICSATFTLVK